MQLSHPDIDPTEAFQFVFREITGLVETTCSVLVEAEMAELTG